MWRAILVVAMLCSAAAAGTSLDEGKKTRAEADAKDCRELAVLFCEAAADIATIDRRHLPSLRVPYDSMRLICEGGGLSIPAHARDGDAVSYPGVDCTGNEARLVPE